MIKLCSRNVSRAWKKYSLRHQKSIWCSRWGCLDTFAVATWHFHFHVFPASQSNPQSLKPRLRWLLPIAISKKIATVPSFQRMNWNWIPGFNQRREQMASPNGYEKTWKRYIYPYQSREKLLFFSSLFSSLALSFHGPLNVYFFRAFRVLRYLEKGLWVSICRQNALNVRY